MRETSCKAVRRSYLARRAADARVEWLEKGQEVTPWRVKKSGNFILGQLSSDQVEVFRRSDQILQDFANVQQDPKDILRFTKRYGVVRQMHLDFIEPPDERPIPTGKFFIPCERWLMDQNRFRDYWRLGKTRREELAKRMSEELGLFDRSGGSVVEVQVVPGARTLELQLQPGDLWQALCLMLIGFVDHLRVCQNEKCPSSPYFIATRRDQKYCDENCSRLVANRRWWDRSGNQWRRDRLAKKEKTKR